MIPGAGAPASRKIANQIGGKTKMEKELVEKLFASRTGIVDTAEYRYIRLHAKCGKTDLRRIRLECGNPGTASIDWLFPRAWELVEVISR